MYYTVCGISDTERLEWKNQIIIQIKKILPKLYENIEAE